MPTTITVAARVHVDTTGLADEVIERLRETCEHTNPDFSKKRAQGYSTYNTPAIIRTWRDEPDGVTLPSGAMGRVRAVLREHGIEFRVRDQRIEGEIVRRAIKYKGHELRDYQVEMVDAAFKRERCVIRAATGSGKTTAAFALAAKIGLNTLIILPSTGLIKQWRDRAVKDLGLKGDQIGILKAGKRTLRPITLASQKTLWSRGVDQELCDYFGAVIVDEAHHAAARTFVEVIDKIPARYRIAFTADERRKDRKEFIVYDLMGDVALTVDRARCEAVGATLDVEIRVVPTDFEFDSYKYEPDFNALLDAMTINAERNEQVLDIVREEVIEGGEQLLMLSHRREHVHAMDRACVARSIVTGCLLGSQSKGDEQEFEDARAGLLTGKVRVGVGTYGALGEGIDLPAVSVGIAMTPIATNKQLLNQVRGRFCRPDAASGKTQGRLYIMYDWRVFDDRVLKNIIAWNRSVVILINGAWLDARQYLARKRKRIAV